MDWIAGVFELLGAWLVGNKNRFGFVFNLIGCLVWVYVAIYMGVFGLLVVVIPAIAVNIRNFIIWGKK